MTTTDFSLAPVYYPATYLRRPTAARLAFIFGGFRVLDPPGLPVAPRDALGDATEHVGLDLAPERKRMLEAVLNDYLTWAGQHEGASYAVYLQEKLRPAEEQTHEVRRALLRGELPSPARPPVEDISWQVFLRLAHDYDRQQDEIDQILARVSEQEKGLAELTGVEIEEMGAGAEGHEEAEIEEPPLPEELTTEGRMLAFGRLWLATGCEGTPVTESAAAHEMVLERLRGGRSLEEWNGPWPVEFNLDLPDAARLDIGEVLRRRAGLSGPLDGVAARLATLQALLKAREWSDDLRATIDLLALETKEAAERVCTDPDAPRRRLRLSFSVLPRLAPRRLFEELVGRESPGDDAASGLYILMGAAH